VNSKISLLGAAEIRELASNLDLKPTKKLGQNFVIDSNTCQKIVKASGITAEDKVVEVGPGLGSLSLAILEIANNLQMVEIDHRLAGLLPQTLEKHGVNPINYSVINQDALSISELPIAPTALVANLPYNVSVPVLLTFLEKFPTIQRGVVMVQAEVAQRLTAEVGSENYGVPTIKAKWWANLFPAGNVARSIFWPIPNVDSQLVGIERIESPGEESLRVKTFALIDAAFSQRRKMLRSSLTSVLGASSEQIIEAANIDPTLRGERLDLSQFISIAKCY
jgi:16S rRNA (adenine1518-N6/adenine1519-N6)-dimethyltransferase